MERGEEKERERVCVCVCEGGEREREKLHSMFSTLVEIFSSTDGRTASVCLCTSINGMQQGSHREAAALSPLWGERKRISGSGKVCHTPDKAVQCSSQAH